MKRLLISRAQFSLCTLLFVLPLTAQETPVDFRQLNSNFAFTVTAPANPTAKYTGTGWGVVYGVGYNFTSRHSVIGEIMWNALSPTDAVLAPIKEFLQTSNLHGHSNLVALTGNYRLQFHKNSLGAYLIGGGGLYYRNVSLSQHVTVGSAVNCTPEWLWWGFSCAGGAVTAHQTLADSSSTAPGFNAGIGFTARIGDSGYKFYVESRYHYARHHFFSTQVVPVSVGIRF